VLRGGDLFVLGWLGWLAIACSDGPRGGAVPRDAGAVHDAEPAVDAAHDADAHDASDAPAADGGSTEFVPPASLADTGLYASDEQRELAAGVAAIEPQFPLWADGATKRRWLYLPPGTRIDTRDMDAWIFPVGTKAWKEFTRDGVRVETRLMQKLPDRWFMMAYAWNTDQTEALPVPDGQRNANGTSHDIPNSADCKTCHVGAADKLLGVSALQLSHPGEGRTLSELVEAGKLSDPPSAAFTLPGGADTQRALGALHANCGSCHNPRGEGLDRARDLDLWLRVNALDRLEATTIYQTTVDKPLQSEKVPGATKLIVPGQPEQSGLLLRIEADRTGELNMPPLATELPDEDTAARVRAFISSL
jgi:hypothetical protein